jgi:hypothetical protein
MRSRRRGRVSGARRVRVVIFCEGLRGLREHNGELVGDARAKGERGEPWQRGSQLTAIAAVAGERRAHRAARMN